MINLILQNQDDKPITIADSFLDILDDKVSKTENIAQTSKDEIESKDIFANIIISSPKTKFLN
jgi:hypothetical protein